MKAPWEWDITDLNNLIGQPESLRLEFKDARLLDREQKGNSINKVVAELSKEVSAFANTEGGTLVIGIEEDKSSKPRVALRMSGVDINFWNPEKLQQILSSNISPPLPGIRVKPIYLDTEHSSCVYIIHIPAGATAYQAKDHIYYGRSEYESKALPDHEIRMRMFRGKVPNAELVIQDASRKKRRIHPGKRRFLQSGESLQGNLPPIYENQYSFKIAMKNIGETSIKSFKCKVEFLYSELFERCTFDRYLADGEFSFKDGWRETLNDFPSLGLRSDNPVFERPKMEVNVYPDDIFFVHQYFFGLGKDLYLLEDDIRLKWTLYLEDRLPCQGEIAIRESLFSDDSALQEQSD